MCGALVGTLQLCVRLGSARQWVEPVHVQADGLGTELDRGQACIERCGYFLLHTPNLKMLRPWAMAWGGGGVGCTLVRAVLNRPMPRWFRITSRRLRHVLFLSSMLEWELHLPNRKQKYTTNLLRPCQMWVVDKSAGNPR
jgi:hypothetical protein